jgi:hypothetical protein
MTERMTESDLPAMHSAADTTAKTKQLSYLLLLGSILFSNLVATISSGIAGMLPAASNVAMAVAAIAMLCGTVLTLLLKAGQFEKTWYRARALAESVKSSSWRYISGSDPFPATLNPDKAEKFFLDQLREMMTQQGSSAVAGASNDASQGRQITPAMKQIRALSCEQRRDVYLRDRIHDQRKWYSDKAVSTSKSGYSFYVLSIGAQLIAVAIAIVSVWQPSFRVAIPLISVINAGFVAWMQARKFEETSQAYSAAAQDLGLIAERGERILCEQDLNEFVGDSEAAISREHTMWVARRDVR